MIKINLLNTKVSGGETQFGFDQTVDPNQFAGSDFQEEKKKGLVKILFILMFPVGLFGYQFYNIGQLNDKLSGINAQVAQQQQQIEVEKVEAQKSIEAQKKAEELEGKFDALKGLAKKRMRELKALDYFQGTIPEKVWLSDLKFIDSKFEIKGFAMADEDLSSFLQLMESKGYFSDVVLRRATEVKTEDGNLKNFEVSCKLGEIN